MYYIKSTIVGAPGGFGRWNVDESRKQLFLNAIDLDGNYRGEELYDLIKESLDDGKEARFLVQSIDGVFTDASSVVVDVSPVALPPDLVIGDRKYSEVKIEFEDLAVIRALDGVQNSSGGNHRFHILTEFADNLQDGSILVYDATRQNEKGELGTWVSTLPSDGPQSDAPDDNKTYGRRSGEWEEVTEELADGQIGTNNKFGRTWNQGLGKFVWAVINEGEGTNIDLDFNQVHLGPQPPLDAETNDLWIDSNTYFVYTYTPEVGNQYRKSWVGVTGKDGSNGQAVGEADITLLTTNNSIDFGDGSITTTFNVNDYASKTLEVNTKNVVVVGDSGGSDPTPGDLWINTDNYILYVYSNDLSWVSLTGDGGSGEGGGGGGCGFDYIPCELNGGFAPDEFCSDKTCLIDGGYAPAVYCDNNYDMARPGVIVGIEPPMKPQRGDLWFDSHYLELRTWYVTPESFGRWVSVINPGAEQPIYEDPDPEILTISGPDQVFMSARSEPYKAKLSPKLTDGKERYKWSLTGTFEEGEEPIFYPNDTSAEVVLKGQENR